MELGNPEELSESKTGHVFVCVCKGEKEGEWAQAEKEKTFWWI